MSEESDTWSPEESVVNRVALFLLPRAPFLAWVNGLVETEEPVGADATGNTYLLPAYEEEDDVLEFIRSNHSLFFEEELAAWTDDETAWPKDRGPERFEEWFDLRLSPLVYDLGDDELAVWRDEDEG